MSSFFENAIGSGLTVGRGFAGVTVTYTRPSTSKTMTIDKVVFGESDLTRDAVGTPSAGNLTVKTDDAMFANSNLFVLTFGVPKLGDTITVKRGSTTDTYRAVPFGPDKEIYRPCDTGRTQLRVHLQRLKST